jgi:hypothetical protein
MEAKDAACVGLARKKPLMRLRDDQGGPVDGGPVVVEERLLRD